MKLPKRLIYGIVLAVVAVSLNGCLVGRYMCNYALLPEEHGNDLDGDRQKTDERYPGIIAWYDALHDGGIFKDTVITGEGGYKLHAVYAPASRPSEALGSAIVIHGYTDNHICFLNLVRMYRDDLNYNVLAPDLHYHGLSEGRAVQMGWLDRLDIIRWIDVAHNVWDDDFMVIHGVSMGGATTMMVSGEPLPAYVRAFVEDCGYSSVWDQFAHNLKDMFCLPPFPVLNSASTVCKHRYGWGFKEASSLAQLTKCDRPMLFIHGENDDFVPTAHVYKNYEAKTEGYKELWIAPGSAHATAYKDHPAEYTERVRAFLEKARQL
jgi:fermentation-respiration switch protein FrsA (DUF1100 family)